MYHATTERRVRWLLTQLIINTPDIFIPNLMPAAYFASKWCKKAGIPTVGVLRSVDSFHEGFLEEFAFGKPEFRQTAFVGVSSQAVEMIHKCPVEFTAVDQIPSPVNFPDHPTKPDSKTFGVLYSGRLVRRNKRIDLVTKAFCQAAKQVPGTNYTLLGDGPDRATVQSELANLGKGLPIQLPGRITSLNMANELSKHHCIVLFSEYEGLPLALMEAMAMGLVPIGVRGCIGVEELIKDGVTGILLDDPMVDFPKAVSRLKNDPELFAKLSKNARDHIKNISALDLIADKWLRLFNAIKHAEGPRRPLRLPLQLNLPPLNPKMACEDDRAGITGRTAALMSSLSPKFIHGPQAPFVAPRCLPKTVDTYTVRSGILAALKNALPEFSGLVADVGAGVAPYKQLVMEAPHVDKYLALDLAGSSYAPPDVIWDGNSLPLADNSVETVMATEVLEHCPDPSRLLCEAFRILKPGGLFFGTVPFLWPLHDVPHDHWRFTPWSLTQLLEQNRFEDIQIKALGGYNAALAQMIGLWVNRRSRKKMYQRFIKPILSASVVPLVWGLTRSDTIPETFREGLMLTGMSITARKDGETA
jgi:glycosyltransferase involved in cell wall biosynthesis